MATAPAWEGAAFPGVFGRSGPGLHVVLHDAGGLNCRAGRADTAGDHPSEERPLSRMARYIEKLRVPVSVVLPGSPPVHGHLSLLPHSEHHAGPETILDRLNEPTRVVPFQRASDGAVLLVNRAQIDWVEAGPDVESTYLQRASFQATREEHVQVRLTSGAEFDGVMPIEMPDEYNRASDYLNESSDFFLVECSTGVRIVNKDHVLETRVYGVSPRPVQRVA